MVWKMKKILFLVTFLFTYQAHATSYQHAGAIDILRTHDQSQFPNNDWITLEGFSTAGTCLTYQGAVILIINTDDSGVDKTRGDRMYANILLAKSGGKTVRVGVDDTYVNGSGYCYIRWINIED